MVAQKASSRIESSSEKPAQKSSRLKRSFFPTPGAVAVMANFQEIAGRYSVSDLINECLAAHGPTYIQQYLQKHGPDSSDSKSASSPPATKQEKAPASAQKSAYLQLIERLKASRTLKAHQSFLRKNFSESEVDAQRLYEKAARSSALKKTKRKEWALLLKNNKKFLSL